MKWKEEEIRDIKKTKQSHDLDKKNIRKLRILIHNVVDMPSNAELVNKKVIQSYKKNIKNYQKNCLGKTVYIVLSKSHKEALICSKVHTLVVYLLRYTVFAQIQKNTELITFCSSASQPS